MKQNEKAVTILNETEVLSGDLLGLFRTNSNLNCFVLILNRIVTTQTKQF